MTTIQLGPIAARLRLVAQRLEHETPDITEIEMAWQTLLDVIYQLKLVQYSMMKEKL